MDMLMFTILAVGLVYVVFRNYSVVKRMKHNNQYMDCYKSMLKEEEGELIGFFCYSVNMDNNEGMLKFVMNNPRYRGQGYGKEMINLAVKYAFEITNVQAVHLNVFPENTRAKKCYESVGFTERNTDMNAFAYKDEAWGRCNMIIRKS